MPIPKLKPTYVSGDFYSGNMPCDVYCGDCVKIVPRLGEYDLIFADPPFNIGQNYQGYNDCRSKQEYLDFTKAWVRACAEALGPSGVICLHGADVLVEPFMQCAFQAGLHRIAWINWHYRFGQCGRSNWIDARCHCLIYAFGTNHTWNPEAVLVESDRVAYGDKRVQDTDRGGRRLPGTVWGVPSDGPYWGRVQGNSMERRKDHPNQLPERYLERLLRAYTNPGDRVLDPFGGSGTTAVVAQALGRRCDTIDVSLESCKGIIERVQHGAVRVK